MGKKGKSKYEGKFSKGDFFGDLTVINESVSLGSKNGAEILTKCKCGTEKKIVAFYLLNGRVKSCGCQKNRSKDGHPNWKGGSLFFPISKYNKLKRNTKYFDFNVSYDDLIILAENQDYKCNLSGMQLTCDNFSIDRIDSSRGYDISNIQYIHKDINIMKNSYSNEYFMWICKLICENNNDIKESKRERISHIKVTTGTFIYEFEDSSANVYKVVGGSHASNYMSKINKIRKLDGKSPLSWHGLTKSNNKQSKDWKLCKKYKIPKDMLILAEYQLEKLVPLLQNPL